MNVVFADVMGEPGGIDVNDLPPNIWKMAAVVVGIGLIGVAILVLPILVGSAIVERYAPDQQLTYGVGVAAGLSVWGIVGLARKYNLL